ncbi:hypothetical protein [Streptomyces sp. NPDC013489]|uniref:hypothetical protein n=1 Tax=Streptomyces sp. NPDC013489 TaxID=3155606 RepID=UPI0033C6ABA4
MSAPTSPPWGAAPRRPARARPRPQRLAAVLATGAVLCSALVALSPGSPASAVSPTGTVTFVNAGRHVVNDRGGPSNSSTNVANLVSHP